MNVTAAEGFGRYFGARSFRGKSFGHAFKVLTFIVRSVALTCLALPASAAWLGTCPHPPTSEAAHPRILDKASDPAGNSTYLIVADTQLAGCEGHVVKFDSHDIISARLLAPSLSAPLQKGFSLSTEAPFDDDLPQLHAAEITPFVEPAPASTHLILGNNLLGEIAAQTFGLEERASVVQNPQKVELTCREGTKPAGMLLTFPPKAWSRDMKMSLHLSYSGTTAGIALGISDQHRTALEDPLRLGTLNGTQGIIKPTTGMSQIRESTFAISGGLDTSAIRSITVSCPHQTAALQIHKLSIQPTVHAPAVPGVPRGRSTWLWQPSLWQQAGAAQFKAPFEAPFGALFEALSKAHIKTLFVTVPVDLSTRHIHQADALSNFIMQAQAQGIAVWAVLGDPQAVMDKERPKFVQMAKAYADYNDSVPRSAQLAGIQYDIEPYLNPGYALNPELWLEAFVTTLGQLKAAAPNLPLDVVVPFFWASEKTSQGPLLAQITPIAQTLTVMAYRTDPALIRDFAQPFLDWGLRNQREVRIALEVGPIANSRVTYFAPAPNGNLALIPSRGSGHPVLLALNSLIARADFLNVFQKTNSLNRSGNTVTFAQQRSELAHLLPQLEGFWSGWASFNGIALHEYLSPPAD